MSDVTIFQFWLDDIATTLRSTYFASCHAILCNPVSPFTKSSTVADIIGTELIQTNGYSPQAYSPGQGSYDSTDKRHELGQVAASFTASGGTLTCNHVVIWQGRGTTANTPVTSVSAAGDTVTISSSVTVTDADPVMVTSSGTQPGGVSATTVYYAKSVGSGVYELYAESALSTKINITDAGSGTITFRLCKGKRLFFQNTGAKTIADGASFPVAIDLAVGNGEADFVGWV